MRLLNETIDGALDEAARVGLNAQEAVLKIRDLFLKDADIVEDVDGPITVSEGVYDHLLSGLSQRSDQLDLEDSPSTIVEEYVQVNADLPDPFVRVNPEDLSTDPSSVQTPDQSEDFAVGVNHDP